jgi:hypothetical protein
MRSNFLATHIRHRFGFRVLPCLRCLLMRCMVLPPLVAPLVPGIRSSPQGGLLELAAVLTAVALAPVVGPADVEPPATAAAIQLEDQELVHPARKDENWTTTSRSGTVAPYRLSIRWPYMRVQAPTWALLRFIRGSDLQQRTRPREFLGALDEDLMPPDLRRPRRRWSQKTWR